MRRLDSLLMACTLACFAALPARAQETERTRPNEAIVVTPGAMLLTEDGAGLIGVHLSGAFEASWRSSGLGFVAEAGFLAGEGFLVGTLTPGLMLNLTPHRSNTPFVRSGFTLAGSVAGFHVGAGFNTATIGSGFRFEGRANVFPGNDDHFFEVLIGYRISTGAGRPGEASTGADPTGEIRR